MFQFKPLKLWIQLQNSVTVPLHPGFSNSHFTHHLHNIKWMQWKETVVECKADILIIIANRGQDLLAACKEAHNVQRRECRWYRAREHVGGQQWTLCNEHHYYWGWSNLSHDQGLAVSSAIAEGAVEFIWE